MILDLLWTTRRQGRIQHGDEEKETRQRQTFQSPFTSFRLHVHERCISFFFSFRFRLHFSEIRRDAYRDVEADVTRVQDENNGWYDDDDDDVTVMTTMTSNAC